GKRTLLDVAIRNADLVCRTFGPNGRHAVSGHEEIELALVKLYRATGNATYLKTAEWLVAERGKPHPDMPPYPDKAFEMYNDRAYKQDQAPVVKQDRAVGHAVRAMYLYTAVADVAGLTGNDAFARAADRLWQDVVGKRLYLTGGVGSRGTVEAFGDDYELPNLRAYSETCASVGNDLWNQRMFLLHGDGKYIDLFERILYNGVLAGVSLAGNTFFYQNPLESNGRAKRTEYFEVACCPANLARMLEQLPGLVFAQTTDTIYANLYIGNHAEVKLGSRTVTIVEDTRYPWDGDVSLRLEPEGSGAFTLALRIPGWARDQPIASDLYRFADNGGEPSVISVRGRNGEPEKVPLDVRDGYVRIRRNWKRGDTIHLTLPMPARRIVANPGVKDDEGRVAIQRGPLVYAVEAVDNGGHALDLVIPRATPLRSRFRADLLNGVEVIGGDGSRPFVAIPYYAWNNRGQGEMAVWIREKP
ncbi:MAG: glycoside hydrolase family 127 protein, partial [Vicinamibacterales bacterium]